MNKKIRLNFFNINFITTIIIAIVISFSFISYLSMYNILSVNGQGSSTTSIFDISQCDEVVNTTTLRGMVHGGITNDCLNGGKAMTFCMAI